MARNITTTEFTTEMEEALKYRLLRYCEGIEVIRRYREIVMTFRGGRYVLKAQVRFPGGAKMTFRWDAYYRRWD